RFARDEVLHSAARQRLHALLVERPGLTYGQLREATGLGRGALVHHLQTLERHRLVVSRAEGPHRAFYPAGVRLPPVRAAPTRAQERVLALLRSRGPLRGRDVAEALSVSRQAASQQLRRMQRLGHVEARVVDGEPRWTPAEAAEAEA
ncbi:MAG TPA: MarR family transcriptional regulator, partial [Candidatus Thermoplasmatota archaeon]|nr:MarR family transcriptional regulator [Candidatus Thermoplasmatota archaeon]